MALPARKPTASLLALSLATLISGAAVRANAALIDQPPRVFSFKLDDPKSARLPLLSAFHDPSVERPGPVRLYTRGPWGRWREEPWRKLSWMPITRSNESSDAADETNDETSDALSFSQAQSLRFSPEPMPIWLRRLDPSWAAPIFASTGASFVSNGFDALWSLPPRKPVRDWRCRRRPVRFVRFGAETDSFELVRCDGTVAPEALDRLTLMARIPEAKRPGEILPESPDAEALARGEWAEGVRLVNPRLLWLLQRIADAFPWRTIYIYSGYRRPTGPIKAGGHHSMHNEARAMDINVMGIPNAELFKFCRTLDDVGCGYYPNSKFVHVDVRKPRTGRAFWIDASRPGEPSRYVDSWPGVVEHGAMVWDASSKSSRLVPQKDADCTPRAGDR